MDFLLMRLFVLGAKSPYGELSFRVTFTPGNENLWNIRCLDPRNFSSVEFKFHGTFVTSYEI